MCAHDKVIVALNADKDQYLNYIIIISGDNIGKVCVRCHDSERLES